MDRRIILLSGPVASGKSMLAGRLSDRFKMKLLRTSDLLRATMAGSNESGRIALQDWGMNSTDAPKGLGYWTVCAKCCKERNPVPMSLLTR